MSFSVSHHIKQGTRDHPPVYPSVGGVLTLKVTVFGPQAIESHILHTHVYCSLKFCL